MTVRSSPIHPDVALVGRSQRAGNSETNLEVGVGERPAAVSDAATDTIVDEDVVLAEEGHDELALRRLGDRLGLEDGVKHARARGVVCHLDHVFEAHVLQTFG